MKDYVIAEIGYDKNLCEVVPRINTGNKRQYVIHDNPECLCKMLIYKYRDIPDFMVRVDSNGHLVDPFNDTVPQEEDNRIKKLTGQQKNFVYVTHPVFERYLFFLRSRNNLHYRIANKEFLNK